jgi:hypothetical protein
MVVLTVCYPSGPDAWFDFDYYVNEHIPRDIELLPPLKTPLLPGIPRAEALCGVPGLDGSPPPFICIGRIWINEHRTSLRWHRISEPPQTSPNTPTPSPWCASAQR